MATKIPKVAGYCAMTRIYKEKLLLYNWTCKSYIVKKVHLNTGDNWRKQNALCVFGIWYMYLETYFSSSVILTVFCICFVLKY